MKPTRVIPPELPEIYCDFNAQYIEGGYSLERHGSVEDLRRLGLTLESAVGRRFLLVMDDADDSGKADDIMCVGKVVHDQSWGYLGVRESDFFWRSSLSKPPADA